MRSKFIAAVVISQYNKRVKLLNIKIFLLVFYALLSGCTTVATSDDETLNKIISSGNKIVRSLDKYKASKGRLPETLEQLVAEGFLESIPDTGIRRKFVYFGDSPIVSDPEYEITVQLSRVYIAISKVQLIYRSDGKYGSGLRVNILRRVDDWAVRVKGDKP